MLEPLVLVPNPGYDRTWTREYWKAVHRYCRILTPRLNAGSPMSEIRHAFNALMTPHYLLYTTEGQERLHKLKEVL
jgi:hypothetical protein